MTHGKDIAQRRQTMFEPGYTEKVVNYCSGVSYTYKDAVPKPEGLAEIDGPAIGDRAPDIDFENGGTLFDRLRHEYFTLLVMPGGDGQAPPASVEKRFGAVVKTEVLPKSAALSRRYGRERRTGLPRAPGWLRGVQKHSGRGGPAGRASGPNAAIIGTDDPGPR